MRRSTLTIAALLATAPAGAETLNYYYDAHGRLTLIQRSGGPSSGVWTRHGFDQADNRSLVWSGAGTMPSAPAPRPPAFTISDASLSEGHILTFVVTRHGSINSTYTVHVQTAAGTATSGVDFTPVSNTISFGPDDFSQTVSVQTTHDSTAEADETFVLALDSPSGGATLSRAQGTGTIVNDDSSNQNPVTSPDYATAVLCGESISVNVVGNDSDPDNNTPLILDGIVSETRGLAGIESTTHIVFSPTLPGTGVVTYRIRDSLGGTATGTLSINITGQGPCQ